MATNAMRPQGVQSPGGAQPNATSGSGPPHGMADFIHPRPVNPSPRCKATIKAAAENAQAPQRLPPAQRQQRRMSIQSVASDGFREDAWRVRARNPDARQSLPPVEIEFTVCGREESEYRRPMPFKECVENLYFEDFRVANESPGRRLCCRNSV